MKKSILIIVAVLTGISAYAQQALWGGPQVVSPEINPDGTVTFSSKAP